MHQQQTCSHFSVSFLAFLSLIPPLSPPPPTENRRKINKQIFLKDLNNSQALFMRILSKLETQAKTKKQTQLTQRSAGEKVQNLPQLFSKHAAYLFVFGKSC